jgi:FAD/FMN-containing dehydrogenase
MPTPPPPGAALSVDGTFDIHVYSTWTASEQDAANLAWMDATMDRLRPSATGHYIGETDLTRWEPERCFAPDAWDRLCSLRHQYDPEGVFHDPLSPQLGQRSYQGVAKSGEE